METDQSKLEKSDDTIKGVNCLVVYGRANLLSNWVVLCILLSRQSKCSQMTLDIIFQNKIIKRFKMILLYMSQLIYCTKVRKLLYLIIHKTIWFGYNNIKVIKDPSFET